MKKILYRSMLFVLALCVLPIASFAQTYSTSPALDIPPGAPGTTSGDLTSTLTIAGAPASITDLELGINITHTFAGDIELTLISPSTTVTALITDDQGGGSDDMLGTYNDESATAYGYIGTGGGSVVPLNSLAAFNGINPNGTWNLYINDDAGGDVGVLNSWSLTINVPTVIANNDANGDGTPDITDPCSCTDPLNPDPATTGGVELFHEVVTVTSGIGEAWNMVLVNSGAAYDITGAPLTLPAAMTEVSPGVYTLDFYHELGVGYDSDFNNGTTTLNIGNSCTNTCQPIIVNDDADGDGTPDIADPCSCGDPLNPDPATTGGVEFFHEVVTINSGVGETWEMTVATTGAYDVTGTPLTLPVNVPEISPGVYVLEFYHEFAVGYSGEFSNGVATLNISNVCSSTCITVPTLGEWGLIILTLLLLNMVILMVYKRKRKPYLENITSNNN